MSIPRRPSLINRTMSTPPATPVKGMSAQSTDEGPSMFSISTLTPPTSPRHTRSISNLSNISDFQVSPHPTLDTDIGLSKFGTGFETTTTPQSKRSDAVIECSFDYEILKDHRGRDQIFGYGAWSTVFKATTYNRPASNQGLATPPLSPIISTPVLVAVKRAARKDAALILENEARMLSNLSRVENNGQFVVPFFGAFTRDWTIVLAAVPLSLDEHIRKCATTARQETSTQSMMQPVIGTTTTWLDLAHKLISALSWLHDTAEVVHGDIKPGNVLLVPTQNFSSPKFSFYPLFIDFSSSQRLDNKDPTPNTLSAITREYTAPELLSVAVLRDPNSTATTASDVFSMAITLLVAATGDVMVYPGSVFQRQAMATQGWQVLNLVRNGDSGLRVPRRGVVERTLEKAVLRAGTGRINSTKWLHLVEEVIGNESLKL